MCIRIYIFNVKKQTNEQQQKQEYKKAKETKKEKRISPENWLKNKFVATRGRFFSSPSFTETRVFFQPFILFLA